VPAATPTTLAVPESPTTAAAEAYAARDKAVLLRILIQQFEGFGDALESCGAKRFFRCKWCGEMHHRSQSTVTKTWKKWIAFMANHSKGCIRDSDWASAMEFLQNEDEGTPLNAKNGYHVLVAFHKSPATG